METSVGTARVRRPRKKRSLLMRRLRPCPRKAEYSAEASDRTHYRFIENYLLQSYRKFFIRPCAFFIPKFSKLNGGINVYIAEKECDNMIVISSILLFVFLLFFLNIITSIWAYRDSIEKGNSKEYAIIVLIGTLFFPILGLIVYLIIRND